MAITFPQPPEGYHWRHSSSSHGSRFDKYELVKQRRFWFDKVVHYEYVDLTLRFPEITQLEIDRAVDQIEQMEAVNR